MLKPETNVRNFSLIISWWSRKTSFLLVYIEKIGSSMKKKSELWTVLGIGRAISNVWRRWFRVRGKDLNARRRRKESRTTTSSTNDIFVQSTTAKSSRRSKSDLKSSFLLFSTTVTTLYDFVFWYFIWDSCIYCEGVENLSFSLEELSEATAGGERGLSIKLRKTSLPLLSREHTQQSYHNVI